MCMYGRETVLSTWFLFINESAENEKSPTYLFVDEVEQQ